MVSTRHGVAQGATPAFAPISDLQKKRDRIAKRMNKTWLVPQNSRGIVNPGNYCYINSTMQSFMHHPIFLNWIRTHNHEVRRGRYPTRINPCNPTPPPYEKDPLVVPDCAACALKDVVNVYWDNTVATNIPLPFAGVVGEEMKCIENIALNSRLFQPNMQDDAREIYDLLLQRLEIGSIAPKWSEEFCTLFTLTINEVKQCIACGHRERSDVQHEGPGMMVDVTRTTPDWNQAITNFFHRTQAGLHCANCATRNHDVETNIVAAPQILRIALQIFKQDVIFPDPEEEDGEVTVNRYKVNHTLQHPDILDLTNHQLHNTFPLQYKLSSVISHSGPGLKEKGGHYIASVRGPGLTPITCISDERRERFSQLQFEGNPQTTALSRGNFQVYILTYVREDVALTTKAQLTAAALM